MQVYWVTFEPLPRPTFLNMGVGVTARSEEDAHRIVAAAFNQAQIAKLSVVEDVASLDQGHVVPNMGNMFARGVWFPLGYEAVAASVR